MKHLLLYALLINCVTTFGQSLVSQHGALHVEGTLLKDKKNRTVEIRGVSLGWSNEHSRFYNSATVGWLKKDWKVSVVRATVGIEPAGGYLDAPVHNLNQVCQVIDGAIKNDLYVVVAWHCNNMHLGQSIDFFKAIAEKYGQQPNIIYEIFTEPDNETWPELKAYYAQLISAIRTIDANNIILVSAPYLTQNIREAADDPIKSFSNIMYTVHFCVGESGQKLRDECSYAIGKGIPVMVSDHLLTDCSCDGKLFTDEWEKWLSWFDENHISWMAWSISDKKEKCSMLLPSASNDGNWKTADLNESGILVRNKLIQYSRQNHNEKANNKLYDTK
jgi:endoglucanase